MLNANPRLKDALHTEYYQFHRTLYSFLKMADSSSEEKAFSRFDLPGLNLPLNWQPRGSHATYHWEGPAYAQSTAPATGEGKDLFKTALNDADVNDGATS